MPQMMVTKQERLEPLAAPLLQPQNLEFLNHLVILVLASIISHVYFKVLTNTNVKILFELSSHFWIYKCSHLY